MSNRFVWVDIPVTDLDRAIEFYKAVSGGDVDRAGGPGFQFAVFSHEGEGVGGCLVPGESDNSPSRLGPLVYLNASGRLSEAVTAVEEFGGEIIEPIHQIGPHGFRAVVLDCEGNRIALHSQTMAEE